MGEGAGIPMTKRSLVGAGDGGGKQEVFTRLSSEKRSGGGGAEFRWSPIW